MQLLCTAKTKPEKRKMQVKRVKEEEAKHTSKQKAAPKIIDQSEGN